MGLLDDISNEFESKAYLHAWKRPTANTPYGYNPYNAKCVFSQLPIHPPECQCNGTGFLIHKKQQEFHENPSRFRALIAGGGSGKTASGAAEMIKYLIENPGARVLVVAPTYPMLHRAAYEYLKPMIPPALFKSSNEQKHEIELTNGCKIWLASMDKVDSVRGPTVAAVWADEASYFDAEGFDLLMFRMRQVGYPLKMWLTTTPRGKNYLWEYFIKQPNDNPKLKEMYWYTQFRTEDNPWFPKEQLEAIKVKHLNTLWGRQELMGEFVGFEGQIYPWFEEGIHVADYQKEYREGRLQFKYFVYGVDWGYTDPTCMLAVGVDGDRRAYVMEEVYKSGLDMSETIREARALMGRWGKGRWVGDSAGQTQIATFNKAGIPTSDAYKDVDEGIFVTATRLRVAGDNRPRLYIDKSCVNGREELPSYHYKEQKEGDHSKPEPAKGQKDHFADCIRYLAMELDGGEQGWGVSGLVNRIFSAGKDQTSTHTNKGYPTGYQAWRGGPLSRGPYRY